MEKIYAAEENFILDYLAKMENASVEDRKAAEDMYSTKDLPEILTISNNTAYISITGPLSRSGPSPLARYFGFGGSSYAEIIKVVKHSEENPAVEKIVFLMDTPGGEVFGVDEVHTTIKACKTESIAVNNGMIASAGYYIASACKDILALEPNSMTGSIGVVITAVDFSEAYEDMGIKIVEIVSRNAPDKRPDIKTEEGKNVLQEQADALENVFMDRVASGRNVPIEAVRKNFGRGSMLIAKNPDGNDAIKVKMIDGLFNEESPVSIIDEIKEVNASSKSTPEGGTMEETMDFNEYMAANPDAKARYNAEIKDAKAVARAEGVEQGQKNIQARVDVAATYLASDEYKGPIQALAVKVLKGESKPEALEGAVTAFDMMKENGKSVDAQADTTALPDTPAQVQSAITESGDVKSEEDYQAELSRSKSALGMGVK